MNCPDCGKGSDVIDTRAILDGRVKRRRRCLNEHRFTTYETATASPLYMDAGFVEEFMGLVWRHWRRDDER